MPRLPRHPKMRHAPMAVFTHHGQKTTFDVAPTDVFVGFGIDGSSFIHDPCDYGRFEVDVEALAANARFPVAIMLAPRADAEMIAALPPETIREMLAVVKRKGEH